MNDLAQFFINEEFSAESVTPVEHERLLAEGWRHFGRQFFRHNLGIYANEIRRVIPLRIRLNDFRLSESQRRVLRRNADVRIDVGPVNVTDELLDVFSRHKRRFSEHQPDSIYNFISGRPEDEPCEVLQQTISYNGKLLAAGFFDIADRSASGIYTTFEPDEVRRSLGVFTILKEIEYATQQAKEFYYLGYCYSGKSFYDYKKRFHATEAYAWDGKWISVPREF